MEKSGKILENCNADPENVDAHYFSCISWDLSSEVQSVKFYDPLGTLNFLYCYHFKAEFNVFVDEKLKKVWKKSNFVLKVRKNMTGFLYEPCIC